MRTCTWRKKHAKIVSPISVVKMGKICRPMGFVSKNTEMTVNWMIWVFEQWRVERNKATSDDSEMCSSNLLQCPVQVSLNYWLLKLLLLTSSFLKTMGDSCYVLFCTLCSRCVDKLLNGIELEELFPWLCGHFVVTVARYFLGIVKLYYLCI